MKGKENITREQFKELAKSIDPKEFQKVVETAKECHDTIKSSVPYNPMRVSDLTVTDFCKIIREIVRDEIDRSLPIHQIPKYEGFKIPNTLGELNDNSRFHATNHTVFESDKFPGWGHGYKEI